MRKITASLGVTEPLSQLGGGGALMIARLSSFSTRAKLVNTTRLASHLNVFSVWGQNSILPYLYSIKRFYDQAMPTENERPIVSI